MQARKTTPAPASKLAGKPGGSTKRSTPAPPRGEPGSRITIFVNPSLSKLIRGAGNVSARLDNASRRLGMLTELIAPRLMVDEWAFVVLALRDGPAETEVDAALLAWAHLYADQTQDAWGVDAFEVIAKIEQLGLPEKVAMCEVVERYWQYGSHANMDHADRLQQLRLITAAEALAWKRAAPQRAEAIRQAAGDG